MYCIISAHILQPEYDQRVCKVFGKRLSHAHIYRRGEVPSSALLSEARNAQNTPNTLKEEVFSASSVPSVIQTTHMPNTLHTHDQREYYLERIS